MSIDDRFKKAIQLRDNGNLELAKEEFCSIINEYSDDPKIAGVYTVLAGVYKDLSMFENARSALQEAIKLNPRSELASLGLYLIHVKLYEYEEAIGELKRYVSSYEPNRYKVTIQELLGDLEMGFASDFKDDIVALAEKHNITLGMG